MKSIIEELYYGNIEPQELSSANAKELKRMLGKLVRSEDELTAELSEKEKEKFAEYVNRYNEFSSVSNADSFVTGFRLGARLVFDVFSQC